MDSIRASEAPDAGSIPAEATIFLHKYVKNKSSKIRTPELTHIFHK